MGQFANKNISEHAKAVLEKKTQLRADPSQ
jgi:hypothetical protein